MGDGNLVFSLHFWCFYFACQSRLITMWKFSVLLDCPLLASILVRLHFSWSFFSLSPLVAPCCPLVWYWGWDRQTKRKAKKHLPACHSSRSEVPRWCVCLSSPFRVFWCLCIMPGFLVIFKRRYRGKKKKKGGIGKSMFPEAEPRCWVFVSIHLYFLIFTC